MVFFIFAVMLKRLATLLLIFTFLIPAAGFTMGLHWCGKTLAAFTINEFSELSCSCDDFANEAIETSTDGCCKDQKSFFKIHDHFYSSQSNFFHFRADFFMPLTGFLYSAIQLNGCTALEKNEIFSSLDTKPPERTELCIFRI